MSGLKCDVCAGEFGPDELIHGHGIRHEVEDLIVRDFPEWDDGHVICKPDYFKYRERYIAGLISEENDTIEELEKDVIKSINNNDLIVENTNVAVKETMSIGDVVSDKVAALVRGTRRAGYPALP